ncbi:glycosyltransferase [Citricoccus muralis]|uniref:Glycosyltransferase involved in cell wall biosynthesis n=1 Tax=Citricoccus muralis TaxID=169134 RepID=A0A3D9LBP1_9MICC|nr:glycosyltransferase [Citricoccus muralis]REE03778.1 hypothetical protein C8E99_1597 [Citricoccus muralis]
MTRSSTVIDSAGAIGGGSARFLRELKRFLVQEQPEDVMLLGDDRQLSPGWLLRREAIAASAAQRISLNNVGFAMPRGHNITLLRNILQFATQQDMDQLGFSPSRRLRLQTPVVRTLAKASDVLVVPCTRMADQVRRISPALDRKLTVRFHPVAKPSWAGEAPEQPRDVLVPIVPQPYKNLDQHLPEFLNATDEIDGEPIRLIVPSTPDALSVVAGHPRVVFIGPQTSSQLETWWRRCGAVFFPVAFESFGYALAESRVYGRAVIAQDTAQNHEIAGRALRPYRRGDTASLKTAVTEALQRVPDPDAGPFDPTNYFQWLLNGAEAAGQQMNSKETSE